MRGEAASEWEASPAPGQAWGRLSRPHVFSHRISVDKVWQRRLGRVPEVARHRALGLDLGVRLVGKRIELWAEGSGEVRVRAGPGGGGASA